MALTSGSIEIIDDTAGTSDGIPVNTPDVQSLPTALEALRGLTGFAAVDPVPTEAQEVGKFVYKQVGNGELVREFRIDVVDTPVADAMWTAKKAGGASVRVLFRERRVRFRR